MLRSVAEDRIRFYLDDRYDARRLGAMYTQNDIIVQFNNSLVRLVSEFCASKVKLGFREFLFHPLITIHFEVLAGAPPGAYQFAVPANFLYPLAVEINGRPARLYQGGAEYDFPSIPHYAAFLESLGGSKVCTLYGGDRSPQDYAMLVYIRQPATFSLTANTNLNELDEIFYELVAIHAARMLAIADDSSPVVVADNQLQNRFNAYLRNLFEIISVRMQYPVVGTSIQEEYAV